jgi:hypothetical protein
VTSAPVNIEAKNHLARLLATENIWIQHRNVETASFDTVSRILTFPNWKDMSDVLYTFLAGHEVGHAIWTQRDKLSDLAKKIDPKNYRIAAAYLNVVEDARIERFIKARYPGLKAVFATAYKDLFDRDFFGVKMRDTQSRAFIDRINLHFKVGHHLNLTFTPEEQALVNKVANTLTFNDVLEVSREIYEYAKHHENQPEAVDLSDLIEQLQNGELEPSDEGDGEGGIEIEVEGGGDEDSGSGKPTAGNGEDSKSADDPGEDGDASGDVSDQKDKKVTAKGSKKPGTGRKAQKPVDPGPPPEPTTQRHFDDAITKFNDKNAQEAVYVTLPTPILEHILIDHTEVHATIRQYPLDFQKAEKAFAAFRAVNQPKINYIFQQFELRKQADRYKRTRIHKTGALDTLRLHSYKFEDELFRSIAIVADGKNHGLIFVVDWSASMQGSMAGTIEQLIVLCLFCRKANVPFEVYSLTTGNSRKNSFKVEPGNLCYAQNFRMRNYLSSRMSVKQFQDACVNLFGLMPDGRYRGGPSSDNLIGCTPLDEAIITAIELVKRIRQRTNAQVVNAVFLTDGGANTVSSYQDGSGHIRHMQHNARYIIDDRLTHKVYDFVFHGMTPTMLRILRDRNHINVVGFYIGGYWEGFFKDLNAKNTKALTKQFEEDGYVISTEWGYNELYITSGGDALRVRDVKIAPQKIEAGSDGFVKAAADNLMKQGRAVLKQRLMLERFVKMIA